MILQIGKILIFLGLAILLLGGGLYLAGRLNLPLGRLPGDFHVERGNLTVYIPLATFLLLSLILTILLNVLARWLKH